jgi:protein tyrosine phosphatase
MESKPAPKDLTLRDALIPDLLISGPLNLEDLSYQELEERKLLSLEEPLLVSKFTAKELEKRNLPKEFGTLYQLCYLDGHKKRMNKDPKVQIYNRYCDILPFETTRVRLNDGMEGVYVNANFVDSALK